MGVLSACLCTMSLSGPCQGQERALDTLELQLDNC